MLQIHNIWRLSKTYDQFAEVLPFQEPHERLGCVLQTIHNVFTIRDSTLGQPGAHLREELVMALPVIFLNGETLHRDPAGEKRADQEPLTVRTGVQGGLIILGDQAAERDPGGDIQQGEDGVEALPERSGIYPDRRQFPPPAPP